MLLERINSLADVKKLKTADRGGLAGPEHAHRRPGRGPHPDGATGDDPARLRARRGPGARARRDAAHRLALPP